jgi:chromosome segregation ATPase
MDPASGLSLGTGIGIAGGTVSVSATIIAFIVWSLKRNVQHEDDAKTELKVRLSDVEKKQVELNVEARDLKKDVHELKGTLDELKHATETNRERMSDFYRSELKSVEDRMTQRLSEMQASLRQDVMRALDPSLSQRVSKLEDEVRELRPRKRARG